MKIIIERASKLDTEAGTAITNQTVAEPILFYFRKHKPTKQQSFMNLTVLRTSFKKTQILDHLVMKLSIFRLDRIEQKEGINEEGKIIDQRDIKSAVIFKIILGDVKDIRKINFHNFGLIILSEDADL